jgi:hypothetical protein
MKDKGRREGTRDGQAVMRDYRAWAVAALLVVGMLIAAAGGFLFVLQFLNVPGSTSAPEIDSLDRKAIGSPSAPVTVVVYSDFQ